MKRIGFLLLGLCLTVGLGSAVGCGEPAAEPAPPATDSGTADDGGEDAGGEEAGGEEATE